jgi:hypothetical protein
MHANKGVQKLLLFSKSSKIIMEGVIVLLEVQKITEKL